MDNSIDLTETLFIMIAAFLTTSIAECKTLFSLIIYIVVSWYLVYRTEEYITLKKKIE